MKNYAVIQHTYAEFLGLIEAQLEQRDIGFSYIRPFIGQGIPGTPMQYDALVMLAGGYPITDQEHYPWLDEELDAIGNFLKAERPVLGIGMGGLLLANYFGGTAHAEPEHVAYFANLHVTEAGKDDAFAKAMDGRRVLIMHNGSVELPDNVEPILVDDDGNWIAIRPHELAYGMLCRLEVKPGMIEDIILQEDHPVPDHIHEIIAETREQWDKMQEATNAALVALVNELDLMRERHKPPVFGLKVES